LFSLIFAFLPEFRDQLFDDVHHILVVKTLLGFGFFRLSRHRLVWICASVGVRLRASQPVKKPPTYSQGKAIGQEGTLEHRVPRR
jgi:hypothetical protein